MSLDPTRRTMYEFMNKYPDPVRWINTLNIKFFYNAFVSSVSFFSLSSILFVSMVRILFSFRIRFVVGINNPRKEYLV